MDSERAKEDIFVAAIQLADPVERQAYVARICGTDHALFDEVQRLLRFHDTNSLLDVPAIEVARSLEVPALTEGPGTNCWSRSAKGGWRWCIWPSSSGRCGGRWP